MNIHTHALMEDLAGDVESLPAVMSGGSEEPTATAKRRKGQPNRPAESKDEAEAAMPAELAALAGSWDSLPEHVRQTIATLCSA